MFRIFKGEWRGPGAGSKDELFIQIGVQFRALLHNFTPSEWIVFTAIALHMDEDGLAYPSYDTLSKETGLGRNAIARALNGLCEKTIDGYPVLIRWRNRDESGKFTSSNRYKIFPTEEETNQSIEVATVANTNGGETVLEEEPTNKAEPVLKNITTKDSGATAPGAAAETPPTLPGKDDPITDHTVMKNVLLATLKTSAADVTAWGEWERASKLLRRVKATRREVEGTALYCAKHFTTFGPVAVAKHLADFRAEQRKTYSNGMTYAEADRAAEEVTAAESAPDPRALAVFNAIKEGRYEPVAA